MAAAALNPDALARERRTRAGATLLRVWLRAEQDRHPVVLRSHRLDPAVLACLLAADTRLMRPTVRSLRGL